MVAREVADKVNDFGRDPIGEGREEQVILFLSLSFSTCLQATFLHRSTTGN